MSSGKDKGKGTAKRYLSPGALQRSMTHLGGTNATNSTSNPAHNTSISSSSIPSSQELNSRTGRPTTLPTNDPSPASTSSTGLPHHLHGIHINFDDPPMVPSTPSVDQPESSTDASRQAAGALLQDWQKYGFPSLEAFTVWQIDKRTHMTIYEGGWVPTGAAREIVNILSAGFNKPWPRWTLVPHEVKERWYIAFQRLYKWYPVDEPLIRRLFFQHVGERLRDLLYKGRMMHKKNSTKPTWLSENVWDALCEHWSKDEWRKKAEQNKKNRLSRPSPHYGGSVGFHEHKRRLELKMDRPVKKANVFEKVHRKGDDGPYSDPKAEQTMATYNELVEQATLASQEDPTTQPIDHDRLFCQATGRLGKGKRLYGLGSQDIGGSAHGIPSSSRQITEQDLQDAVSRAT